MSMSNTFETELLTTIFQNADLPLIGDAAGLQNSAADGSLYVAWHTADPGEAGTQTTSECAYTGYGRIAVTRTSTTGWTVASNAVSNTSAVTGNQNTGSTETARFWSIGTASTGTGKILYRGHLGTAPIAFTATTADLVTAPGHTFADTNEVVLYARPGATLPTGVTDGTVYFVRDTSGDTFKVALTSGGAAIDLTAAGAGVIGKVTKLDIANLVFPEFAAAALSVTVD
jgi:hypothetical protein